MLDVGFSQNPSGEIGVSGEGESDGIRVGWTTDVSLVDHLDKCHFVVLEFLNKKDPHEDNIFFVFGPLTKR